MKYRRRLRQNWGWNVSHFEEARFISEIEGFKRNVKSFNCVYLCSSQLYILVLKCTTHWNWKYTAINRMVQGITNRRSEVKNVTFISVPINRQENWISTARLLKLEIKYFALERHSIHFGTQETMYVVQSTTFSYLPESCKKNA